MAQSRPYYTTRLQFDAGDAMLFIVPGVLLVLFAVAAPPLLSRWFELGIPTGWPRVAIEGLFALLALLVLVHIIFKHKAIFMLSTTKFVISYPLRLNKRGAGFEFSEIAHIRIGENDSDYWMRLFLRPQPGRPDEIEIRFEAYEEDLFELCRELENVGIEAVYFQER
ncbi:MAG: hypothetical protein ACOCZ8_00950 [Bacteroidota bacterium]